MKYEDMYKTLKEFKQFIDKLEHKEAKKILLKFYKGYDETLKEYTFERLRRLYH